jgi:hypothetical protein
LNGAGAESRLAPLKNSPHCPAPAADERGLMSSVALAPPPPLPLLLLLLLDAPLRTDGAAEDANLPAASTRFRFTLQGSVALPKLLPGRFRCGIASFSLSKVRSFFCSCAMEITTFRLIIQNSCECCSFLAFSRRCQTIQLQ